MNASTKIMIGTGVLAICYLLYRAMKCKNIQESQNKKDNDNSNATGSVTEESKRIRVHIKK